MKILYPDYRPHFACLAGACPDSCCEAWEICVDPDTVSFYRSVKGPLGERLRRALSVDEEGDAYFPLRNGKCPFLNQNKLCDVHAALGEAATSAVCRQYPDFIEEYDGFTERCPSLSCPAAAKLIFAEPLGKDVYPVPPDTEDSLLNLLIAGRAAALQTAAECDFAESAVRIRAMAEDLQEIADGFDPSDLIYDFDAVVSSSVYAETTTEDQAAFLALRDRYLSFLLRDTEILTEEWRVLLERTVDHPFLASREADSPGDGPTPDAVKRALRYFLYRYFLKPVNDGDILLWTAFILLCVAACIEISRRAETAFEAVARRYSKEIEHDPETIDRILDFLAEQL